MKVSDKNKRDGGKILRRGPASLRTKTGLLMALLTALRQAAANPLGGTVAHGTATISPSGPHMTINQSSGAAMYNWQSFNIGSGESVTFNQPSSSSIAWNFVTGPTASTIDGSLTANGLVVLQNPNGISIGGSAAVTAHGLILTTSPTPPLNLTSSGPWTFDTPPPAAKIINYGQINITGGGPAFLIGGDLENDGTISAPGGQIGLYAGQKVMISTAPDGRGLNAEVTLPQGSVNNQGQLIADRGSIEMQAAVVNQNGLLQANTVQNVNGTIELVASDSMNIGASSAISAQGDSTAGSPSPGGFVILNSANAYSDTAASQINVGGASGGQDGIVEIFGNATGGGTILSGISSAYALLVNPYDLTLYTFTDNSSSPYPALNLNNPSYPLLNANALSAYSQIRLEALDNIELSTPWTLKDSTAPASLSLSAGNSIILDDRTRLVAGKNWGVNMTAGTSLTTPANLNPGSDGIYLNGSAFIQTQDGDINLSAANEVIVADGAIRTVNGGNISVTAQYGDVNAGDNVNGYLFGQNKAPYYVVNAAKLGGISTAAGGNVDITAGGNVYSYLPTQSYYDNDSNGNPNNNARQDGGTGAFGPQSGNVSITAGGSVYGHYVLANGIGTIVAGGDVGVPAALYDATQNNGFALSLINGQWNVYAPNGNIYVQDVRNPNGIFGEKNANSSVGNYAGFHLFDYSQNAGVLLDAGGSVEITGLDAPHLPDSNAGGDPIPILFPPSLQVITGTGDFTLDTSVTLFPSPDQNLNLSIGGNFIGIPNGNPINLFMSDSPAKQWVDDTSFGLDAHSPTPLEMNNATPVEISVAGNVEDVNIYTTKATDMTVGGDMRNAGFLGENLSAGDATTLNVAGEIFYSPQYAFAQLSSGITSANPLQSAAWDSVFDLAINPAEVGAVTSFNADVAPGSDGLAKYLKENNYLLFPSPLGSSATYGANPGFIYDPSTKQLGFSGSMASLSAAQVSALESGSITVLVARDAQGDPYIDPATGHLATKTYTFNWGSVLAGANGLYNQSLNSTLTPGLGLQIGGPGQFNIHAGSIDLGNSSGIGSSGFGTSGLNADGYDYSALASLLPSAANGGASITVNVDRNLSMLSSGIYSRDGGNVNVNAGGEIDLSQGNFVFTTDNAYGIYASGHSDVNVTAGGDINVGNARIATFNGGNVSVESQYGNVNIGSGINVALTVYGFYNDPATGLPAWIEFGNLADANSLAVDPAPYGSGILAEYPTAKYQTPGSSGGPGNITVTTPRGNITSTSGGVSQFALDGSSAGGSITLQAGTAGVQATASQGNISLGGVVIGGTDNILATGASSGIFVARRNLNLKAKTFVGLALATQKADLSVEQSGTGPVIVVGGQGIDASGLGQALLLSQNVSSDGGAAQSTLGTSANASAASQSAAQQSNTENQQVASNDSGGDDEQKKKKGKAQPLLQRVKRVTVLLPKAI